MRAVVIQPRLHPAVLVGVDKPRKSHHLRAPAVIEVPEYRQQASLVGGVTVAQPALDQTGGSQHLVARKPQCRRQLVERFHARLMSPPALDVTKIRPAQSRPFREPSLAQRLLTSDIANPRPQRRRCWCLAFRTILAPHRHVDPFAHPETSGPCVPQSYRFPRTQAFTHPVQANYSARHARRGTPL